MQDRFDSLEFYAKTNTNSSVFHNLIPSTYYPSGNKSGTGDTNSNTVSSTTGSSGNNAGATISLNTSRSRTPAPIAPRPRIPISSSSNLSSTNTLNSYTNGNTSLPSGSFDSTPSSQFNRSQSRQSSVERNLSYPTYENYSSTNRLSDYSTRSRNSSPSRSYETSSYNSDRMSSNGGRSTVLSSLPPHPTSFHYDSYTLRSNARREPSVERYAQLRNRREASQERAMRPSVSSSYLTHRRSSFVDQGGSKYY